MRYLYLLLLLLGAQAARGQAATDTTAADALAAATPSAGIQTAAWRVSAYIDSTGLCTEMLSWGGAGGLVRIYYGSGLLKEYVPYADLGAGQVRGLATTWYENGQMASRQPFRQGQRDGRLELYYADGQLKRETDYVAGAELPGRCFDAAGRAVPYFPYEQLPLYPGGHQQLAKEINRAMRWPHGVYAVAGLGYRTVYLSFWVAKDGSIRQPQVAVSSQLPLLDRAVLATVQKLTRRFMPARRDGLVVESKYYIPVQFSGVAYPGWAAKN